MSTVFIQRIFDIGLDEYVTYQELSVTSTPTVTTVPPGSGPYDASTHTIVQVYNDGKPKIWNPVSVIGDLPTVNVLEGDQCWVVAEDAMYYAEANGGSWAPASGGGGGGVRATADIVVGFSSAPYSDTADDADFLDTGDGAGLADALAAATALGYPCVVELRSGTIDMDPSVIPFTVSADIHIRGAGKLQTVITAHVGDTGVSQAIFSCAERCTLSGLGLVVPATNATVQASLAQVILGPNCTVRDVDLTVITGVNPIETGFGFYAVDPTGVKLSNMSGSASSPVNYAFIGLGDPTLDMSVYAVMPEISNISISGGMRSLYFTNVNCGAMVSNLNHALAHFNSIVFDHSDVSSGPFCRGPMLSNVAINYDPLFDSEGIAISIDANVNGGIHGTRISDVQIFGSDAIGADIRGISFNVTDVAGSIMYTSVTNVICMQTAISMFSFIDGDLTHLKVTNLVGTDGQFVVMNTTGSGAINHASFVNCVGDFQVSGAIDHASYIGCAGTITLADGFTENTIVLGNQFVTITDGGMQSEIAHNIIPEPG